MEDSLRIDLLQLSSIIEFSEDAIISRNLDGIVTSWNPSAERLFGYQNKDIIGKNISLIIPPELFEEERELLKTIQNGQRIHHFRTRRLTREGTLVNVSISAGAVKDLHGQASGVTYIIRDISNDIIAEQKQAILAAIVESSDDAIISKDLNGIINSWNKGAEKIFGYTDKEILGKHVLILIPASERRTEEYIVEQIKKDQQILHFETLRLRKDGCEIPVSITVSPVKDPTGKVIGASTIARDITFQKQAEEKQAILAAIVASSDDAIISKNLSGIITSWNSGAQKTFGYESHEVIGKHISILIPPGKMDEENYIISKIITGEKVDHYITVRLRKDGSEVPVSITVSPVRDNNGRIIGASKIARDISYLKMAEEKQARLAAIVDSSDDGIVSKNLNGIITSWNKGAERIFGYTEAEIIGKHVTTLIPKDKQKEEDYIISKIVNGENVDHFQTTRLHKSGKPVSVSITVSPVKDSSGKIIGASKIARDVSKLVETQEQINIQNEKLRNLNRAKDDFIGMASHELKTPLTTIKAYLQVFERNLKEKKEEVQFIQKILKHVNNLANLVSDLLDVSKIEAGKLQLNFSNTNIKDSINESIEAVQQSSSTHKIECDCETDIIITADKLRIEQVIINLLTNAIKYSPKANKVIVGLEKKKDNVLISVQDFGIGIPSDQVDKIFTRFFRVEGLQPQFSGLGIGLYISYEIVKRHNGNIWVESNEGKGSTFYVQLPIHQETVTV